MPISPVLRCAIALAVMAAACSSAHPARPHGEVVVVLRDEPLALDPRFVWDGNSLKVSRLLFASLVTIDPYSLDVVPDLAERYEWLGDRAMRVRLRPGLRFSDGSTLDADDVRATFASVVDPALGSRFRATYEIIERVEVVSAQEVVFHLREPHATFVTDLELPIVRAEDARVRIGEGGRVTGSGPYALERRAPGHLYLRANPLHRAPPARSRLHLIVVRDENVRALRLRAGAIDVAVDAVPPRLAQIFRRDARFAVESVPGVGVTYLGAQTEHIPDARVRRAIAFAIDRAALARHSFEGYATVATGLIPVGHWAEVAAEPLAFDPRAARALLDQAGLHDPDGDGPAPRVSYVLRTSGDRFRQSIARAVAAQLHDVGIEIDVRPTELGTLLEDLRMGRFDLALLQIPEVFEPHVLSWFLSSEKIPAPGRDGANRWRYRNPELDELFEAGTRTTDRDARRRVYADVQRILREELPIIPLVHEHVIVIASRQAGRVRPPRDGRLGTIAHDTASAATGE